MAGVGAGGLRSDEQVGHATALKLACNGWLVSLTAAAAQSVTLTQQLGVDPRLFLDAIKGGTQDAPYLQNKGAAMIDDNFAPAFALDAALKDVELLQDACQAAGVRRAVEAFRTRRLCTWPADGVSAPAGIRCTRCPPMSGRTRTWRSVFATASPCA